LMSSACVPDEARAVTRDVNLGGNTVLRPFVGRRFFYWSRRKGEISLGKNAEFGIGGGGSASI